MCESILVLRRDFWVKPVLGCLITDFRERPLNTHLDPKRFLRVVNQFQNYIARMRGRINKAERRNRIPEVDQRAPLMQKAADSPGKRVRGCNWLGQLDNLAADFEDHDRIVGSVKEASGPRKG